LISRSVFQIKLLNILVYNGRLNHDNVIAVYTSYIQTSLAGITDSLTCDGIYYRNENLS